MSDFNYSFSPDYQESPTKLEEKLLNLDNSVVHISKRMEPKIILKAINLNTHAAKLHIDERTALMQ